MTGRTLALGPFLAALEERLARLDRRELEGLLLSHAEALPSGQRAGFLAVFDQPEANGPTAGDSGVAASLLDDIDGLVAEVAAGTYFEGWGWDGELREERAFGDESWVWEMDSLFAAAGDAFVAGDLELARDAYGRLLHAFELDSDVGTFCGPVPAPGMVTTDLGEAKARYLRALYETCPAHERPARLLEEVDALLYVGDEPTLRAVAETRREELADLDAFLPGWIDGLEEAADGRYGLAAAARSLLSEAAALSGGPDALGELARRASGSQGEAYRDWIDALVRVGRHEEAETAAREALATLAPAGRVRATIAERLLRLAARRGDGEAVLEGRREAWRASPTLQRLMDLVDTATALGQRDAVLTEEAGPASSSPSGKAASLPGDHGQVDDLRAALLLLAGQVQPAIDLLDAAGPLGWSRAHPGPIVVPYLLVAASRAPTAADFRSMLLFESLEGADRAGWPGRAWHGDEPDRPPWEDQTPPEDSFRAIPTDELVLSLQLVEQMAAHPPTRHERERWMQVARGAVEQRRDAIVGAQHRGAYDRAARLICACAEALSLHAGDDAQVGGAFVADAHRRWPRHSAFRRELDAAAAASPVEPVSSARR